MTLCRILNLVRNLYNRSKIFIWNEVKEKEKVKRRIRRRT